MNIYKLLSKKQFLILSSLLCFAGDLLLIRYLYLKFNNYIFYKELMQANMARTNIIIDEINPVLLRQQFDLMINAIVLIFILVISLHIIIYLFYLSKKKFAENYVKMLSWLGVPSFFIIGLIIISSAPLFAILFIIQGFFYLYIILGLKFLNGKNNRIKRKNNIIRPQ